MITQYARFTVQSFEAFCFTFPPSWDFIFPPWLTHTQATLCVNPLGSTQTPGVSPDTHTLRLVYPILTSHIELKQQEPKLNSTIHLVAVFP